MQLADAISELRMSEEDLIRADGQTLRDYRECVTRLGTLQAEADRHVKLLEKVCEFLREDQERFATGGLEEALNGKLIALMNDLHTTRQEKKRLRKYLPIDD
jgi:hypothetical protein